MQQNPLFEQHQNTSRQPEHPADIIDFEAVRASRHRPNSFPDRVIAEQRAESQRRVDSALPSPEILMVGAIKGIDGFVELLREDAMRASMMFASEDSSDQVWNMGAEDYADAA